VEYSSFIYFWWRSLLIGHKHFRLSKKYPSECAPSGSLLLRACSRAPAGRIGPEAADLKEARTLALEAAAVMIEKGEAEIAD
jgi:hypothetical protein